MATKFNDIRLHDAMTESSARIHQQALACDIEARKQKYLWFDWLAATAARINTSNI